MTIYDKSKDIIKFAPYTHGDGTISVTSVLSHIHEDYIADWANYLGFKKQRYRETLNMYAREGTLVHSEIEQYLKAGSNFYELVGKPMGLLAFVNWYRDVSESGTDIRVELIEAQMVGTYVSGTLDALMKIGNELHVVDYKTSSTISYKHILQLSVYKYMLNQLGYNPTHLTVLQVDKNRSIYHQYTISADDPLVDEMMDIFINTYNSFMGIKKLRELNISDYLVRSNR